MYIVQYEKIVRFIKNNALRKFIISYKQYTESYIGTIKPMINNLRHTVSESTFVFYSSSV